MPRARNGARAKRSYHKGNVAEDLYAAAMHILKTETFEDVSVRRLSQMVGVTPANFYNHYPSLNHLMQLIAAQGFRELTRRKRAMLKSVRSRRDAARRLTVIFVEFAVENRQVFRLMFGLIPDSLRNEALREATDEGFSETVEIVYGKRLYDPSDIPASHKRAIAAYGYFALAYGLAHLIMDGQFIFASGQKKEMIEFVEAAADCFILGTGVKPFEDDGAAPNTPNVRRLKTTQS